LTSTRCGISAKPIERELGVTYKTAHRMMKKIRTELMTDEGDEPLSGDRDARRLQDGVAALPVVVPQRVRMAHGRMAARCSSNCSNEPLPDRLATWIKSV
jgi:hypothetical protein